MSAATLRALAADFRRATGAGRVSLRRAARVVANDTGLQALFAYRLERWLSAARGRPASWPLAVAVAPALALTRAWVRWGYDIRLDGSAEIGPGLRIYHFGGIRVRGCRVGASCVLHHEVRIEPGAEGGSGPQLGDRVWVGPHARISGGVRIGDGATISAGAVVTADVAPNTVVAGDPARVVRAAFDNRELLERDDARAPSAGGRGEGGAPERGTP